MLLLKVQWLWTESYHHRFRQTHTQMFLSICNFGEKAVTALSRMQPPNNANFSVMLPSPFQTTAGISCSKRHAGWHFYFANSHKHPLCCPQDARCQANDPDRVQQALTPKQTRFRGLNDAQHSPEHTPWSPPIHGIDRSGCFRYQCVTRNKKPRQEIHQSSVTFWFNPVSVGGKAILYAQWTIIEQSVNKFSLLTC